METFLNLSSFQVSGNTNKNEVVEVLDAFQLPSLVSASVRAAA